MSMADYVDYYAYEKIRARTVAVKRVCGPSAKSLREIIQEEES